MSAKRDVIELHLELARSKWKSSGISDEQAGRLGLRGLTADEVQASLETQKPQAPGLLIPYFGLDGKQTDFFRVRYLTALPGFAGAIEKPQRYTQKAGTVNEVYYPPLLPVTWQDVAEDPNAPIYITEGELKAASACAHGMAMLGLGGVDVWRATKKGLSLLPSLEKIKWRNRQVTIVYDSDAAINPQVVRAQQQLAKELLSRGAFPKIATIPAGEEGAKQGVDDYIVANGFDEFQILCDEAAKHPESAALWDLNAEIVYIRDPGVIVELATTRRIAANDFVKHAYANRHCDVLEQGKGEALVRKKKPVAPLWLAWPHRHEATKITYAPGKPRLINNTYNCWPGWGVEPKKGDVGPWLQLLEHLYGEETSSMEWFIDWAACPLQRPGEKLYTSCLTWGVHTGTGKTAVAYALRKIYGDNGAEIKSKDLKGGFNQWAANRQFIIGDEITGGQARVDADWLKGTITQSHVRINEKYKPEYIVPDCINYYFTSNHPDALFLEDADRRYFVHEVTAKALDQDFYDTYDKWLHGDGPSHLFHYLLERDLKGFNSRARAPETSAKKDMIIHGKSDVAMWVHTLKEDPARVLKTGGWNDRVAEECHLFTAEALLRAYDVDNQRKVTSVGMGKALKAAGLRQVNGGSTVRTPVGSFRFYSIRDPEKWVRAAPKEVSAHYMRYFVDAGVKKYG